MGFWSTERLVLRHAAAPIIFEAPDGNPVQLVAGENVRAGSYILRLGPEAYVTSSETGQKQLVAEGEQVVIPPGQFGVLLTKEQVHVPDYAIAFISIRAGIKFRGLVNVSGFHVDPGFVGRLLFAVYNAGSNPIILTREDELFPIWFADLSGPEHVTYSDRYGYKGNHEKQRTISSEVVMDIQGEVASPAQLKRDIEQVRSTLRTYRTIAAVFAAALLPAIIGLYTDFFKAMRPGNVQQGPLPHAGKPAGAVVPPEGGTGTTGSEQQPVKPDASGKPGERSRAGGDPEGRSQ